MDWRKPKHRRIGEKDGLFDWKRLFDSIVCVVCCTGIILVLMYGGFQYGRYLEGKQITKLKLEIETLKATIRVIKYGSDYHHFEFKGQAYYVKDKKDLENESKWIRVK